jgi:hypothetical protein
LIAPGGIRAAVEQLIPGFEWKTGQRSTPATMVGFISARAKDPAAARAILDYLSSQDAAPLHGSLTVRPGR